MNNDQRISLARKSLKGTSIGDAFGESYFGETDKMITHIRERTIPETSWEFTDDTVMAIAIYDQLRFNQGIDQDELISQFVKNHKIDPNRGYGATARRILREIEEGVLDRNFGRSIRRYGFDGQWSFYESDAYRGLLF